MLSIKSLIKNIKAKFNYYRTNHLYYSVKDPNTDKTYQFSIHTDDLEGASINRNEEAIILMKWIREANEKNELVEISSKKILT